MSQRLGLISIVVRDYDEALAFYTEKLGFRLVEDTPLPDDNKRWLVVAPTGQNGCALLLARASNARQMEHVGDQTGGRVFLFLYTDSMERDYGLYSERGVQFVREPSAAPYGTVAVFKDLYGNLWDLIEPRVQ